MIRRRVLLISLAGVITAPLAAAAQPAKKIARIGFPSPSSLSDPRTRSFVEAFRQGLRDLGWVEGQTVTIEYRWAEERTERPRVAVLSNPTNSSNPPQLRYALDAAQTLGVRLHPVEARGPGEIDGAFAEMTKERTGAVILLLDSMLVANRTHIAELAAKRRLPAIYGLSDFVQAGGLVAYGPQIADMYRRAATYVDKLLKGSTPTDLPVEQPTKFELVINLKTAKALGRTIPRSLLLRADQIIE